MKKNNNLVLVTNDTLVNRLKEESNVTFLFPVKNFCVGFPKTFELEEIKEESFIFVNRILDTKGIDDFKKMLQKIPERIKGIVFDDIGILNVLREEKIKLAKILFLNHMNCNSMSINAYLEYVDSVVISTDITREETKNILKQAKKPLVVYSFGHVNIMYSRRTLLTNYNKHFKEEVKEITTIEENQSKHELKVVENIYGTVIYTDKPFNNLDLREEENILYNLINTIFLTDDEVITILQSKDKMKEKYPYEYLSEEETIFKINDIKD